MLRMFVLVEFKTESTKFSYVFMYTIAALLTVFMVYVLESCAQINIWRVNNICVFVIIQVNRLVLSELRLMEQRQIV